MLHTLSSLHSSSKFRCQLASNRCAVSCIYFHAIQQFLWEDKHTGFSCDSTIAESGDVTNRLRSHVVLSCNIKLRLSPILQPLRNCAYKLILLYLLLIASCHILELHNSLQSRITES